MLHLAGMALGSLTGCGFADLLGRRQLLLVAAQLLILAPLASVQAPVFERWNGPTHQVDGRPKRVAVMLVSRFIMGIATGASSAVIPVYIMEVRSLTTIHEGWHSAVEQRGTSKHSSHAGPNHVVLQVAPAATRHALSNLCQMGTWAGIVAAMVANTLLPAKHWRAVLFLGEVPAMALAVGECRHASITKPGFGRAVCAHAPAGRDQQDVQLWLASDLRPILLLTGMLVCPETPSWLVAKGRQAEADAAARWLWGPNTAYELSYLPGEAASGSLAAPASLRAALPCKH